MEIIPTKITDFNRSDAELQSFWLFSAFCAGKNSDYAARCLSKVLRKVETTPFNYLSELGELNIRNILVASKIGQYGRLTRFIMESLCLDLRTATVNDLMGVFGVGPKTARFFLVHTRPNASYAILDTHILKYLVDHGVERAGKNTPTSLSHYEELERKFLFMSHHEFPNMTVSDIDLMLWMKYSGRLENDILEPELVDNI